MFRNYFDYLSKSDIHKALNEVKNLEENTLFNLIKILQDTPRNDAKQIEILYEIRDILEPILYFSNKDQDKKGPGLNISTPSQLLGGLPFSLAQLNVGNNSEKLKNEIRQVFYSLYRSKTSNQFNSLIDII